MAWTLDARIPLLLVKDEAGLDAALAAGPPAALLAEAPALARPGLPFEAFMVRKRMRRPVPAAPAGLRRRWRSTGCSRPGCAGNAPGSSGWWRWLAARRGARRCWWRSVAMR